MTYITFTPLPTAFTYSLAWAGSCSKEDGLSSADAAHENAANAARNIKIRFIVFITYAFSCPAPCRVFALPGLPNKNRAKTAFTAQEKSKQALCSQNFTHSGSTFVRITALMPQPHHFLLHFPYDSLIAFVPVCVAVLMRVLRKITELP